MTARAVLAVLLLALAARLAALLTVGHPEFRRREFALRFDEPDYHAFAQTLATAGRYSQAPNGAPSAFRPPGFVVPLAGLYWLFGTSPAVGFAYVLACSLGVVLVVGWLARETTNRASVSVTAMLIAALLPTLVFTGAGLWLEPQTLLCMLSVLLLLVRTRLPERSPVLHGVLGLAASLAYLTRPAAASLIVLVSSVVLYRRTQARHLLDAVVFFVALSLPILAWGIRNQAALGRFFVGVTITGPHLWASNNPVTAGTALPAMRTRDGFDLYEEARLGQYHGSWVPEQYIPGWREAVPAGLSEMEVHTRSLELARSFVRDQPLVWLRLLGYKFIRIVTAEPYAPSISGDVGSKRFLKRAATFVERWFILIFGVLGVWRLYAARNPSRHCYTLFLAAGIASLLASYVNARLFLPVTATLVVPAAVIIDDLARRRLPGRRRRASRPWPPALARQPGATVAAAGGLEFDPAVHQREQSSAVQEHDP